MANGSVSARTAVALCLLLMALGLLPQSSAEDCCSAVPTGMEECLTECEEYDGSDLAFLDVWMQCRDTLPELRPFWACFNGLMQNLNSDNSTAEPEPHVALGAHCCEETLNVPCKEACTQLLSEQNHLEGDQVFEALTGVCNDSQHIAVHPVVTCIVQAYSIHLPTTPHFPHLKKDGVDFARVQCCTKAKSVQCREDCFLYHTYPSQSLYEKFNKDCRYHPFEYALLSCFEDVYAPSKPGCSGLRFCHMFNNHPAEFFRYCWVAEDNVAEDAWFKWKKERSMSHTYLPQPIPLKDISLCQSEQWKTLACLLHIRPTDDEFHTTTVCREDCEELLNACADTNRLSQLYMSVQSICSKMAPSNAQKHCVHLSQFTDTPQTAVGEYDPVQQPCNRSPCSEGQACVVNSACSNAEQCTSYSCVPGCYVGLQEGLNSVVIPQHQLLKVTVPLMPYNKTRTLCHAFHACSDTHLHLTAKELTGESFYCEQPASCNVGTEAYAHGTVIEQQCNVCSCQNGRVVCTNWNCRLNPSVVVIDDCSDVGVSPVCTPMGQTLRHPCHTSERWAGSELADGSCGVQDGCEQHHCPTGSRCIPIPSVCVAASSGTCKKHICAQIGSSDNWCTNASLQGVCDTSNQYYSDLCSLLSARRLFNYWGACKNECSVSNPVCGVDGNTYSTPCHAQGVSMAVDYLGSCLSTCDSVECDPLPSEQCSPFTPPGACCPKCGGLVTLVVDSFQLQNSLPRMGMQQVTVRDIATRLEEKLNTLHCRVYAYLSQESSNTVYVLITPASPATSANQIKACRAEAQAMVVRVNTRVLYYSMDSLLTHIVAAKHSSDFNIVIANASVLEAEMNGHSRLVTPFFLCVLVCAAVALAAHFTDITY